MINNFIASVIVITGSNINDSRTIFDSLFLKYQKNLFEKMKGRAFILDCVDKTNHNCHKITVKKVKYTLNHQTNWKATINTKIMINNALNTLS